MGRILLVDRANGNVAWFDSQGVPIAEASCHCAVDRIERVGAAGLLRLISPDDGPAWLTETDSASQRLFFVPGERNSEVQP